jgi:8-oxo-dGTP diphosphatase
MAQQQFPILAASACVWRGGEVLLIRRPEGVWAFPGGKVELGETVVAAAQRELLEETGITADIHVLAGVFDMIRRNPEGDLTHHFAIACYVGRWLSGEAMAASDAQDVRWVVPETAFKLSLAPHIREVIGFSNRLIQSDSSKLTFV